MDIYAQNILDHYKNPRNSGEINNASASVKIFNPTCGDQLKLDISVENEKLKDVKFSGNGCAISQSAISILSEEVIGLTLAEAEKIDKPKVLAMLGVNISERRIKCALMSLLALKNALRAYKKQQPLKWVDIII